MPKAKRNNPTKPLSMTALTAHVEKANAEHDYKVKWDQQRIHLQSLARALVAASDGMQTTAVLRLVESELLLRDFMVVKK
jgi:hypothetical protein